MFWRRKMKPTGYEDQPDDVLKDWLSYVSHVKSQADKSVALIKRELKRRARNKTGEQQ